MPVFLLPLIVFGTIVFLVLALSAPSESVIDSRLRDYGYRRPERDLTAPFSERVLMPVINGIANLVRRLSPVKMEEDTRLNLARAGNPANLTVTIFLVVKAAAATILPLLILFPPLVRNDLDVRTMVIGLVVVIIGWKGPDVWINSRIGDRQEAMQKALPDALDLIVVCVEAGNGLEAAVANVTRETKGPLSEEFDRTLREMALGKLRREAFRDLSQRTGVADLQSFIAAILQADQLGVSIGQVLRVQAEAMRTRRRQRAEEAAAKVPVKMLFPMIMLIFPAIFIVVLAPAAMKLIAFFASR
jgi:tight adherence protein C